MKHEQFNSTIFALTRFLHALNKGKIEDSFDQSEEVEHDIDSLTEIINQLNDGKEVTISPDRDIMKQVQNTRERFKEFQDYEARKSQ
jgi:hypothetical protein